MHIGVDKIITFGNKEKYLVLSHIVSREKNYYYIAELEENEKDIKENYKIVEETQKADNLYLDEVVGEANLKIILPLFVEEMTKEKE